VVWLVCLCALPLASSLTWNLTGEYLVTGTGTVELSLMIATPGSFCFFVTGRAWYKDGESCQLAIGAIDGVNTWMMYKESGQKDFECGARCASISGDVVVSGETLLMGQGLAESAIGPLKNTFCFLMDGRCWFHDGEICRIDQDTQWILHKESGQTALRCGSQCVTLKDAAFVNVTNEVTLMGTGDKSAALPMKQSDGFCFITHARSWYEGGESCVVSASGGYWILQSTSGQSAFECGARCVSFSS